MRVKDLFSKRTDEEIFDWVAKFDDPIDLLNAVPELFEKLRDQDVRGEVHDYVDIRGPVFIGKGSVIHANVVIDGPVYIGENVSVRSHSQLRKGVYLGSQAVVGHGADIKASLCLNESKIQDGTFCGDSLLGYGARIGSGAILANRKFNQTNIRIQRRNGEFQDTKRDFMGAILGDYARIGANAVLSPGTIVGQHTWVGSAVTLLGTYEADQLITAKQELEIKSKDRVVLKHGHGEYEKI